MAKVIASPRAKIDLEKLLKYLGANGGHIVAQRYDKNFKTFFRMLEDFPESKSPRPHFGRNVRLGVIKPYNIFYRYDSATDIVTILRIIHSKRNITKKLIRE